MLDGWWFHLRQIREVVWLSLGTTLTLLVVFEFQVEKEFFAGGDFFIENKTA